MLWLQLLADAKNCLVLRGVNSSLVAFCLTLRNFWYSVIVFPPMISINDMFDV